jgi:hypothetical protein
MVCTAAIQNECDCFKHDTKDCVFVNKGCSRQWKKPSKEESERSEVTREEIR